MFFIIPRLKTTCVLFINWIKVLLVEWVLNISNIYDFDVSIINIVNKLSLLSGWKYCPEVASKWFVSLAQLLAFHRSVQEYHSECIPFIKGPILNCKYTGGGKDMGSHGNKVLRAAELYEPYITSRNFFALFLIPVY